MNFSWACWRNSWLLLLVFVLVWFFCQSITSITDALLTIFLLLLGIIYWVSICMKLIKINLILIIRRSYFFTLFCFLSLNFSLIGLHLWPQKRLKLWFSLMGVISFLDWWSLRGVWDDIRGFWKLELLHLFIPCFLKFLRILSSTFFCRIK
jgi:hypothetical protein